jgi:glycosyltransferase involved in cell wall biosynthesis
MRVSVIIPVHNTERYVGEAIDSVLSQSRPPDEVIVVDDGSTDRTPAILNAMGGRITVLRQRQSGSAAALNAGIARATGDHLAFNDADDIWLPDKLKLQCNLLSKEPEIEAIFGMVRQFISPDWNHGNDVPGDPPPDQLGVSKVTMVIRRDRFERIGMFDPSMRYIEFMEWYARAKVHELRTHMISEVLVLRRIHATNTGRVHADAQRQENLRALKRMLDLRRHNS